MYKTIFVLSLISMISLLAALVSGGAEDRHGEGLIILTGFPSIAHDIRMLACEGDRVISLSNGDPHSSYITVEHLKLAKLSDILIIVEGSEVEERLAAASRGVVISVSEHITGVSPGSMHNIHGALLDPFNYIAFMERLASTMSTLRPECSDHYLESLNLIKVRVGSLLSWAGALNRAIIVSDHPSVVNAFKWMGAKVIVPTVGHEGYVNPRQLMAVESALSGGAAVVITSYEGHYTRLGAWLKSRALSMGLPIYELPPPYASRPIISVIEEAVKIAEEITALESRR